MNKATLYITEQGARLRKKANQLLVIKDNQTVLELECIKVQNILIFGNVEFSTQLLNELFEHGIEFAFLTYDGQLKGQLTPVSPKNIALRLAQYQKSIDNNFNISISRSIIDAKIRNSVQILKLYNKNRPNLDLTPHIKTLEQTLSTLPYARDTNSLLGKEGSSAREYFKALTRILPRELGFKGRRKRPAPDPVNAMLSLSYSIITSRLHSLLDAIGFEPYLGFLHSTQHARPSLALDLLEEFRQPLADRLVLFYLNKRTFKKDDFYFDPSYSGVLFKEQPFKKFLYLFEKALRKEFKYRGCTVSFLRLFRYQAEMLAKSIQEGIPYQPFTLKRET